MQVTLAIRGLWVLYAVCPQSTADHACIGGRYMNMPVAEFSRPEFCEWERDEMKAKYPHIEFQCTRDYTGEISWTIPNG